MPKPPQSISAAVRHVPRRWVTRSLPRFAILLGWSAATWAAGVVVWLSAESRSGSGLDALSGGLMIAGSALLLAGLLRLPVAPSSVGAKLRLAMDGALVAVSILFVAWEPAVAPAVQNGRHGTAILLATLGIPVADVICVTTIGALLWRSTGRRLQVVMYLPVGAALTTAVGIALVEHRMRGPQLIVLLVIAALLMARQWITLNENRRLLQRVAFQAEHDDLTGLLNRSALLRRVSAVVAGGGAVRVHLIDLDRFKDVNDAMGHPVGDELLVAVGQRLRRCVRGLQVARLGGDEFAVIDGRHDALGLAERLLAAIREPYTAAGRGVHLEASLGIAEWSDAAPAGDPDRVAVDLLRDADAAMYAAKAAGGGAHLFADELRRSIVDRVALGRELRDALARDELTLAYQPVVDLRSGIVTHVEALARWDHPQRGPVPPGVFIPIAEASGLMQILGRWVLRTACAQAAAWSRDGFDIGVCVNVSPQQLDDSTIVRDVSETLRRTRLAPGRLILELTEALFVDDSDAVRGPLEALRAAGSKIAIDDFGTGYSALSYLRRLPVDILKLDRRFLAELGPMDVAVLTTIVGLAHALGLETIAEGIETSDQRLLLRRLGCGYGQGYHLARPMAAADVPGYLQGPLEHAA
jgi:diguanylate cyclase (GGDEF)-like protein